MGTHDMDAHDRAEWLAQRRNGIGASDIAAVLGISPWKTPLQLYLDKRGELPPQEDAPQLRRGRMLEPLVLDFYADETGHQVTRQQECVVGAEPWMLATLDGFDAVDNAPVEAKTVSPFLAKEFGEHGTDEVPLHYAAQVHWQMMLTDASKGYLAALIGIDDFRIFTLLRDHELESLMIARATEFWQRVLDGNPPDPSSELDIKLLHPRDTGSSIEATPEIADAVAELAALKAQAKDIEAKEGLADMKIKAFMGDNATLFGLDGKPLATWKTAKGSQKTDWKAVTEALAVPPEIIAAHTKTSAGSRRFLIK